MTDYILKSHTKRGKQWTREYSSKSLDDIRQLAIKHILMENGYGIDVFVYTMGSKGLIHKFTISMGGGSGYRPGDAMSAGYRFGQYHPKTGRRTATINLDGTLTKRDN